MMAFDWNWMLINLLSSKLGAPTTSPDDLALEWYLAEAEFCISPLQHLREDSCSAHSWLNSATGMAEIGHAE
jgi:hypothetical protein